jgi:cell wall-associated NlpC family hydrolase
VGRLTANGLLGVCTVIPEGEARPGDLVFFQGTYDTEGASHVAIYVGDQMVIHCGNPVSYANLQDPYYREHLLAFGRLN